MKNKHASRCQCSHRRRRHGGLAVALRGSMSGYACAAYRRARDGPRQMRHHIITGARFSAIDAASEYYRPSRLSRHYFSHEAIAVTAWSVTRARLAISNRLMAISMKCHNISKAYREMLSGHDDYAAMNKVR